jgi:hypothetical protein
MGLGSGISDPVYRGQKGTGSRIPRKLQTASVSDIENGNKIKCVPKFFYYWVLLMEEDNKEVTKQEGFGVLSGNVPLTNGSGSMKPKNIRILRIGIPNTVNNKKVVQIHIPVKKIHASVSYFHHFPV